MLDHTFMQILDMSKTASIVILVVLLARLLLKKAPKVFSYALWAVVLFRLLCPVTFEAPVSIVPEMTSVSRGYTLSEESISVFGAGEAAYQAVGDALNGGLGIQHIRTTEKDETGMAKYVVADWRSVWILFGQYVWVAGIAVMLLCSAASYMKIRKKLAVVLPLRDNILMADDIKSPFVIGLFRPKIYLPCNLGEKEQEYIILHEQHHIKRLDHIVKALAFLALTIHWFNPLVWVAFILAGKDMEMSCDEAVIRKVGGDVRADYSASLLTLATGRRVIAGTPLAFGEGDTNGRIRNLANWRKPAFWGVLVAVIACIVLAIGLLTNPAVKREFPINGSNVSELDTEQVIERIAKAEKLEDGSQLCVNADNFDLMFTSDFDWANDGAIRFFYVKNQKTYSAQLRMFHDENKYFITDSKEWIEQEQIFNFFYYLDALKYMPQEEIRKLSPDADGYSVMMRHDGTPSDYERVLKYSQNGVENSDGWYIHLEVHPLHEVEGGAYNGSGDEVIHLFYSFHSGDSKAPPVTKWFDYLEAPDEMNWSGGLEIDLPEFPEVTFRWYPEKIEAVTANEIIPLYTGMPIWNTYFCDLTGDALPELCSTYTFGSGMIDSRVIIYDYANGASYTLEERGSFDYTLRLNEEDGQLWGDKKVHDRQELVASGPLVFADNCIQIAYHVSSADPLDSAISTAILDHYASDKSDGLIHAESHVLLANECMSGTPQIGVKNHMEKTTVYLLVLHQKYSTYGGKLEAKSGSYVPTAITFTINESGEYILEEYWEPRDGSCYADDIRGKFPGTSAADALHAQAYIKDLKKKCYDHALAAYRNGAGGVDARIDELLNEICDSSVAFASNPDEYIEAHKTEYQELLSYGEFTLRCCFDQFLMGDQTDLRGYIMAKACDDISLSWGEAVLIDGSDPATGQEWFDEFLSNARELSKQHQNEALEKLYPASWLLLDMMGTVDAAGPIDDNNTIRINRGDYPIFDGPGYDNSYVGAVQKAGVYTIVEEQTDREGNVWGKLRSGAGWIDMTKAHSEEGTQPPITAVFGTDELLYGKVCHEYLSDSSDYAVKLMFTANEVLTDVCFASLQYENGSYVLLEELDSFSELRPETPFVAEVAFYGDMTTYGISFTDSDGNIRSFAVYISSRNGALVLDEYHL